MHSNQLFKKMHHYKFNQQTAAKITSLLRQKLQKNDKNHWHFLQLWFSSYLNLRFNVINIFIVN